MIFHFLIFLIGKGMWVTLSYFNIFKCSLHNDSLSVTKCYLQLNVKICECRYMLSNEDSCTQTDNSSGCMFSTSFILSFLLSQLLMLVCILYFFEMYKVGNVDIKDLCRGQLEKNQQKGYLQWGLNWKPSLFQSNALLSKLTWQVLVERYLTCLLLG